VQFESFETLKVKNVGKNAVRMDKNKYFEQNLSITVDFG